MAGLMYGADADELEAIAKELDQYEQELGQLLLEGVGAVSLVGLSATLNTIWMGPRATEFAGIWEARHLLRIREVQATLKDAASDLRTNAADQRRTSLGSGGKYQPPKTALSPIHNSGGNNDRPSDVEGLEWLEEISDAIGLGEDVWEGLVKSLRITDPDVLKALGDFIGDHLGVLRFAEGLSFVGDAVGALTTFAKDFVQQYADGLPLDEVILHATFEMAGYIGVDAGLKKFSAWAAGAITGAITAGVGAPVGAAIGWFGGEILSEAAKAALDAFDGLEHAADFYVMQYRMLKSGVEFVVDASGQIVEIAGEAVDVVIEGGEVVVNVIGDVADDVVDGIVDVGANVIDAGGDLISGGADAIEDGLKSIWNRVSS